MRGSAYASVRRRNRTGGGRPPAERGEPSAGAAEPAVSARGAVRAATLIHMASQIITLVGVLLGAVTSFFATTLAERAKFRQAMATRWDERTLDSYVEYVSCVKETARFAGRVLDVRERGEDPSEALLEMEAAEARRSVLFEGFVLLAENTASQAASTVNERLWDLLRCARRPQDTPDTDRELLGPALIDALNDLHKAARTDLAIGTSRTGRRR